MPSRVVCFIDGSRHQRAICNAVRKIIRVEMPSTAMTEKCAIIPGENAKSASAKFAAPSENHLRHVRHRAIPRITPSKTFTGRPVHAMVSGEGDVARTCSHSYQ